MSNVKLFYLVTGEQIVGDATEKETSYMINNPLSVIHLPENKLGFIPYLQLTVDTDADFDKNQVRHVLEPTEDVVTHWNQLFGSGIVTPSSKIVT